MSIVKNIFKTFVVVSLISSSLVASPIEITKEYLHTSSEDVRLFHDEHGFIVKDNKGVQEVKSYNVNKAIRNISNEQLETLLGKNNPKINIISQEEAATLDLSDMREMTEAEKKEFCSKTFSSGYISITQTTDGEYILQSYQRTLGGGGLGAFLGAIGGKFLVHAVAGGVCTVIGAAVTLVAGPVVGGAVGYGLYGVMAPAVEVASNVAAMAGGITGGVIGGPI